MTKTRKSAEVKQSDARSYDATAAEFGTLTERYSTPIAARMLDLGGVKSGDRLLDVGTGTGLLARMAAARGANAVGIDHSAGMLGQAQARADQDAVGSRTQFLAMDAEALQFQDAAPRPYVLMPDPAAVRTLVAQGSALAVRASDRLRVTHRQSQFSPRPFRSSNLVAGQA